MSIPSMKQSAAVTSFRKKTSDVVNIRGTRVSVQNAQLLTSTGSPTLDFFIGGGLAIGTICLIEEDRYSTYSELLLKYFLAEGVTCNHSIYLASGDKSPSQILKEIPAVKTIELSHNIKEVDDCLSDNLKIAWRYKSSSTDPGIKTESYNHGYDLSKTMPEEMLKNIHITAWDPSECNTEIAHPENFIKIPYSNLFEKIESEIVSAGLKTSSKNCGNILRIGICSIGSPLWNSSSEYDQEELSLVRFMYMLKSLLRTSFSVALLTIPSYLTQKPVLISRIRQMCDTVISLESFVGSEKRSNPLFKDFDGLLHVIKLPVLNTFLYQNPTSDLAFKLKRKGFTIERLHLPPDLEDPPPEQQGAFSCGGLVKHLDF